MAYRFILLWSVTFSFRSTEIFDVKVSFTGDIRKRVKNTLDEWRMSVCDRTRTSSNLTIIELTTNDPFYIFFFFSLPFTIKPSKRWDVDMRSSILVVSFRGTQKLRFHFPRSLNQEKQKKKKKEEKIKKKRSSPSSFSIGRIVAERRVDRNFSRV